MNLMDYDYFIVAFSGGKDSTACVLHLLDSGVPAYNIELWHHDVDGNEEAFMDWPITKSYCTEFARALGMNIYFSWKEGGFKREMLRENTATAPIFFEVPVDQEGAPVAMTGGRGPVGTRRMFPQVSASLSVRWCSSYLKIDVGATAIRNQKRFLNKRTLFVTGERGEESAARAKYKVFEPDRADLRHGKIPRHVDHYRPLIEWKEKQVWDIIEKHKIVPHPAYYAGWGRLSCLFCIFGNAGQFKSAQAVRPVVFDRLVKYEQVFGKTIKRKMSLETLVEGGVIYIAMCMPSEDMRYIRLIHKEDFTESIFTDNWILPAGAYGDSTGPT